MKKIIALALSLILVLSLSVTAFAAGEITAAGGTNQGTATGTYEDVVGGATVYSVDVDWINLAFKYVDTDEGTWNATNHDYDDVVPAHWELANDAEAEAVGTVTVVNHSNAPVDVTIEAANASEELGVKLNDATDAVEDRLTTGDGVAYAEADFIEVEIAPFGALTDANKTEAATLATITVTIGAVPAGI